MAKAENQTQPTKISYKDFLNTVEDETQRKDSFTLADMMQKITKEKPVMWGPAIVGFGHYHYKYDSGREGDGCIAAFSPRKGNITLYIGKSFDRSAELLARLGKHKMSGGCLHLKKLADVDEKVLKEIIGSSFKSYKKKYQELYGKSAVSS
jgi:hypothetical protein